MNVLVEFHAWITIRQSYLNVDEDDCELQRIILNIKRKIKDSIASLVIKNGEYCLTAHSYSNHLSKEYEEFFEIVDFVQKIAVGSYGVIYLYDDESLEKNNLFQVYVIKKGKLQILDDVYLSPFIPEVEEE